jgi:hypothetical protein
MHVIYEKCIQNSEQKTWMERSFWMISIQDLRKERCEDVEWINEIRIRSCGHCRELIMKLLVPYKAERLSTSWTTISFWRTFLFGVKINYLMNVYALSTNFIFSCFYYVMADSTCAEFVSYRICRKYNIDILYLISYSLHGLQAWTVTPDIWGEKCTGLLLAGCEGHCLLFGTWECHSSEAVSQPLGNLQLFQNYSKIIPNTVNRH